jgi:hypothetical protein
MLKQTKVVTAWVALFSLIGNPGVAGTGLQDVAGAVGNLANQASYMIFNPTMQNLALQDPAVQLELDMKQCEMGSNQRMVNDALRNFNVKEGVNDLLSNKFKDVGGAGRTALTGKRIVEPENFDRSKFGPEYCESEFPVPAQETLSCFSYYKSEEPTKEQKEEGDKNIEKEMKKISNYRAFMQWKMDNCANRDEKALEAEIKIYECKEKVMKNAVAQAATALQNALQANQAEFKRGEQFIAEVGDQIRQVDELLGPEDKDLAAAEGESGNQFKGLFGIQRSLNKQLAEMNSKEADFKTRVEKVQQDTTANEQNLESSRMVEVSKCMQSGKGVSLSGGRALTCYVGRDDARTGRKTYVRQACGPMEWLKSQVSQSAFITSRGVMRDQRRTEESESFGAEFDSLQSAILKDLGEGDEKGEGGKLVTRETNWNDISRKHASAMQELSAKTGVNVSEKMNAIAGTCFGEGDAWRKQQKKSMTSVFNKQKAQITKEKDTLNGELRNSLTELNKSYRDAMSVLSGQVANLNRYSCTNDDPEKMQNCFVQMKQGVSDLLEGNGMSATSKTITGGTQPPPYALAPVVVACKGIDGCITTLKNIRTGKKTQLVNSQKQLVKFVNESNGAVKTQLGTFAGVLARVQQSLKGQFGKLNTVLARMGAATVKAPAAMEAEQLKQSQGSGKNGEGGMPGPFENPGSMSKVLSGMMQPDGLTNFDENGLKDVREAAKAQTEKKKEEIQKKLADFKDSSREFKELKKECLANSEEKVNNIDCSQPLQQAVDFCKAWGLKDATLPLGEKICNEKQEQNWKSAYAACTKLSYNPKDQNAKTAYETAMDAAATGK